uniref:uncharacterized protein LOC122591455 n=1 Tax=Erigeron canadensis TaxID=72917 RepID=UPI001CB96B4A|nr:uncharacterized protein LOC122591455 [Erigeron canadensis]
MIDDFKEELRARDPRSVVDIEFEKDGKFNGVLAAATTIDSNNSIFPVAYGVLESENTKSWTWFLELLKRAIGMPNGLVISSDMQKGLEVAITQVYSNIEHRECIRHLYSNFKRHFRDDFFYFKLWGAAIAYCVNDHDKLLDEIVVVRKEAITYLIDNHNKIWSRCKFGTTSKCDYITNNISESFNSWVGDLRYRPVLDLLDAIREKLMKRFDKKMRNNLGEYAVSRSSDNRAEVTYKGKRWNVILDEKKCSCRVCYKKAYALEIVTIPTKDRWVHIEAQEMIYPPSIKRPPGRPRKNQIVLHDQPKKRHRCHRCNEYGHHAKKCKNSASQSSDQSRSSTNKRRRNKNVEASGVNFKS